VKCPTCDSGNVSWLAKARVWKCYSKHERPKFSLNGRNDLRGLTYHAVEVDADRMAFGELQERHQFLRTTSCAWRHSKTAWLHAASRSQGMQSGSLMKMGGNEIEVDESFIGGKMRTCTSAGKRKIQANTDGKFGKTIVLGILDRKNKQVRTAVIPDRSAYFIQDAVDEER